MLAIGERPRAAPLSPTPRTTANFSQLQHPLRTADVCLPPSRRNALPAHLAVVSQEESGRMDPVSITASCLALLSAAVKTSIAVTTFVRGCRDARADLTSVSGELTQLQLVLELLKDDTDVSDDRILPEPLQRQILSIIASCSAVLDSINQVLQKYGGKTGAAKWTVMGKTEVAGLRMSLEAHRGSLSLVLELVSVSLSKSIKEDTTVLRTDVHGIKQDTSQIMAELARLRAIVAAGDITSATRGQNYVLEQYLDNLTSYAETVCQDVVWDSDGSLPGRSSKLSPRSSSGNLHPLKTEDPLPHHGEATTRLRTQPRNADDTLPPPLPAADAIPGNTQEASRASLTATAEASAVQSIPSPSLHIKDFDPILSSIANELLEAWDGPITPPPEVNTAPPAQVDPPSTVPEPSVALGLQASRDQELPAPSSPPVASHMHPAFPNLNPAPQVTGLQSSEPAFHTPSSTDVAKSASHRDAPQPISTPSEKSTTKTNSGKLLTPKGSVPHH